MTILIDTRWIGLHGIGRFAREISQRTTMKALELRGRPLSPFDPLKLSRHLQREKPTHFFSPGFNAPLGKPCPFSLTVHDLIHLEVEEERSPLKTLYYERVLKPALHRAEVVFTGSEHARSRIAEWSSLPFEKIIVTGHGVGPEFKPEGPSWPHTRPYLLYVGNQKPHKNVEGLVKAFAASGLFETMDLLLTGHHSKSVKASIAACGMAPWIRALGEVPEENLPALYRSAEALVMPSRYEGFGLPLIEAMASGTPVLTSDRTSLKDVAGNAALTFDPDDVEHFVAGLHQITEPTASSRLKVLGLQRASLFRWDQVAAKISRGIEA